MDLCRTKYPIMLVHGMGYRDRKYLNYWGRIPKRLEQNGAEIFYGNQDANATIEENARQLEKRLDEILEITGAEKVNIIAHSKGGLEARYLISTLKRNEQIASLSTISTPHNGSVTVKKLLEFPEIIIKTTGKTVDFFMKICGDKNPDTCKVFYQLSSDFAEKFNACNPDSENIYYQSFGFAMKNSFSDIFMIIPHFVVSRIEGENDGLLSENAVKWTNYQGTYKSVSLRGISHCDEVDMRRLKFTLKNSDNNYEISDITDFYISLVKNLKLNGF